jgi:hypothetical protein
VFLGETRDHTMRVQYRLDRGNYPAYLRVEAFQPDRWQALKGFGFEGSRPLGELFIEGACCCGTMGRSDVRGN